MVSIVKIDRISIMADAAEAITTGIEESGIIIIRNLLHFKKPFIPKLIYVSSLCYIEKMVIF